MSNHLTPEEAKALYARNLRIAMTQVQVPCRTMMESYLEGDPWPNYDDGGRI